MTLDRLGNGSHTVLGTTTSCRRALHEVLPELSLQHHPLRRDGLTRRTRPFLITFAVAVAIALYPYRFGSVMWIVGGLIGAIAAYALVLVAPWDRHTRAPSRCLPQDSEPAEPLNLTGFVAPRHLKRRSLTADRNWPTPYLCSSTANRRRSGHRVHRTFSR